jgi:hypothetical protein
MGLPGLLGLLLVGCLPATAVAQTVYEGVGSRALGMAGAFVAVADDPTATYWNPAGLATAGPGVTFEWARLRNGNQEGPPVPGPGQGSTTFSSVGSGPLAVSFGRFSNTRLVDDGRGGVDVETLATRQYGVTVLQTIVPGLVVGSTLKYVRGRVSRAPAAALNVADALDFGADLEGETSGAFDLDVGVMADLERLRVGLTWKNLRTPEFSDPAGTAATLPRFTRLGVAVFPVDGLTLAMDIDLDTVDLRDGLRRMIAFGGESRLGARLLVRGGVRWNLEGLRRPVTALGASLVLRRGLWLDGHWSRGQADEDRGFGFALRAGY